MPAKMLSQQAIKARITNSQTIVGTWDHLHRLLGKMTDTAWIFRGVSSPEHYPIPSIGREKQYGPYKRAQEERLFQEFKHRAVTLIHAPEFDNWHWLAYAQHLGVPTRLLDWTASPLIAAFFALQGNSNTDRAIYCVKYSKYIHEVDQRRILRLTVSLREDSLHRLCSTGSGRNEVCLLFILFQQRFSTLKT